MASDTDRFVLEANIERYRKLLITNLSPATRETVTALLAESEGELRRLKRQRRVPWQQIFSGHSIMALSGFLVSLAQAA